MKKLILNISILFIVFSFAFIACDDGIEVSDIVPTSVPEVYVYHTNPKTGQDYTAEELAELSYNPKYKEQYLVDQPVELYFMTKDKPLKVDISHNGTLITSLTNFQASDNGFKSEVYATTVTDLGLEIGDKAELTFYATYPNTDGLGVSSISYLFEVKHIKFVDPDAIQSYFVFLNKSNGDVLKLEVEGANEIESVDDDLEVGTKLTFDGTDDKITVKEIPELAFRGSNDFSIGFWVNTTATNSDPSMVGDKDWGGGTNKGFVFAFKGSNWKINAGDGSNRVDVDASVINDGAWHYLTATFDRDGDVSLYQDGVLVGSADMSSLGDMAGGNPITLGQDGTGAYKDWFEGKLGNVDIFDYVLSVDQVAGIATKKTGFILHKSDGLFKNYTTTLDGGASSMADEGKYIFQLDGTDDMVVVDNSAELDFRKTGDFTISAWVKTEAKNSDPSIIGDKDWGGGKNSGFVIAYKGGEWKINIGDGTNRVDIDGGNIGDGEWHHIAATIDKDGMAKVYQDAVEVNSGDASALGDFTHTTPIRIGQDGTGSYGHWFEGQVADVKMFDSALSAEAISALAK